MADEVRNLAGKSASAAKQTTQLIEGSIQDVEDGSKIADRTAKLFSEAEEKVQLVGGKIEQIGKASAQPAIAIKQITQGVEQISAVVQTNSATAEQSAASSEELSAQAEMLRNLVAQFKLRDGVSFEPGEYQNPAPEYTELLSPEEPNPYETELE